MDSYEKIKEQVMEEIQEGMIEVLLYMKKQILDELTLYLKGPDSKCLPAAAAVVSLQCKATLATGTNKGSRCSTKSKDGTEFCGRHKKFLGETTAGKALQPLRCRAILHAGEKNHKQCDHPAKSNSHFCGIHKTKRPSSPSVVPLGFSSLEDKDKSLRRLQEATPHLYRLKNEGVEIPIPNRSKAVPSKAKEHFTRHRENFTREMKQEIAELRVVADMVDKEKEEALRILDQPPTSQQITDAKKSENLRREL